MSINYAKLRKDSRRQSLNMMQYHKLSQNKTFTESFPVSLHQSKSTFKIPSLEFDNNFLDFKSHPFTFEDKTKSKTEATKKKFVFDDHPKKINEYIDFLNESSDFTQNSDENMLLLKFQAIRYEKLKQKCKSITSNYKNEKYQNALLRQQLIDLQCQLEEERRKSSLSQLHHQKLKQQHKELQVRMQYLQNSYLREKLKNENQKLLQQSISISDTQEESSHETIDVKKFLKSQMRKLRKNNQQIDNYSRLYKKYSEHNHEDF